MPYAQWVMLLTSGACFGVSGPPKRPSTSCLPTCAGAGAAPQDVSPDESS
jgi:hypothetical protein